MSIDLRAIIGGLFIDIDITNTNRYSLNLSAITNGRDFSNYKSLVSLRRLDSTLPIGGVTSLVKWSVGIRSSDRLKALKMSGEWYLYIH